MQRGNAFKALREDATRIARETRESQGGEERDPLLDQEEQSQSRMRWRRAGRAVGASVHLHGNARRRMAAREYESPGSTTGQYSFFATAASIIGSGPGMGLRKAWSEQGDMEHKKVPAFWSPKSDIKAIMGLLLSSYLNVFLVLVPLGYIAAKLQWSATLIFSLNFFGIIPLALILGDVTEDLALRSGEVIGGLVNATFGNVVELILSCVALTKKKQALNNVAGLSNLGSILSNLLLVLGCCFLAGGCSHHVQSFNAIANQVCNSLLFLAVVGLSLPIAAATMPGISFSSNDMLHFSRIIAILLLLVYLTYLYFQLVSHNDLFTADKGQEIQAPGQSERNQQQGNTNGGAQQQGEQEEESDEEDEQEEPVLTITAELSVLMLISVIVAMASELITDSIQDMAKSSGLTTNFLSIVLLPLAGNAVEHITAVMVAMKNKMDLSLGIAIGSSIQIALFVLPTCVLFSWAIGNNFTLQLDGLGVVALAVAIIHANFITAGGRSHYLMGVQLICTYLLISSAFLFTRD